MRPRICLSGTALQLTLTLAPSPAAAPSGAFPSRPPHPLLVLLHPSDLIIHPAASSRREELSGRIICQPRFSRPLLDLLSPSSTWPRVSRGSCAETGSTSLPSHSGQTPDMVVLPRCHTGIRLSNPSLPLPDCLTLPTLLSAAPARLSQQWRGRLASQASRSSPAARPIVPLVWACTSRRRTADPFVKLVSYLQ